MFLQQVLSFSDYLASGESFTELCDRLQPLLGSCVNLDKVAQPQPKLHKLYAGYMSAYTLRAGLLA